MFAKIWMTLTPLAEKDDVSGDLPAADN